MDSHTILHDRNEELGTLVRDGRLLPIQVQLAASLGYGPARAADLPVLNLRLNWIQWLVGIHHGLPSNLRRVLRSATRSSAHALPPMLSVSWGADCAERALPAFEFAVPGDERPGRAIETARAWSRGQTDTGSCRAAVSQAQQAIQAATAAAVSPFSRPKVVGRRFLPARVVLRFPAEAAAYAAREAAVAVPCFAKDATPKWQVCDHAAIYAGHAADYAARVDRDAGAEHSWQRQRLIELILSWDADQWRRARS